MARCALLYNSPERKCTPKRAGTVICPEKRRLEGVSHVIKLMESNTSYLVWGVIVIYQWWHINIILLNQEPKSRVPESHFTSSSGRKHDISKPGARCDSCIQLPHPLLFIYVVWKSETFQPRILGTCLMISIQQKINMYDASANRKQNLMQQPQRNVQLKQAYQKTITKLYRFPTFNLNLKIL